METKVSCILSSSPGSQQLPSHRTKAVKIKGFQKLIKVLNSMIKNWIGPKIKMITGYPREREKGKKVSVGGNGISKNGRVWMDF